MKPQKQKEIPKNSHVFICGQTGTGKTLLTQYYLAGYENVIFLDPKRTFKIEFLVPDIKVFEHLEDLMTFGKGKAVYRPVWEEQTQGYFNAFYEWIFKRQNCIVYTDELMRVCRNSQPPEYLLACMVMGRELNIGVWNATQRPKTIPLVCISESDYFFIFKLNLEADRKRIMEVIPFKEIEQNPNPIGEKHNYWYFDYNLERPVNCKLKV